MPATRLSPPPLVRAVFLGALMLLGPGACRSTAPRHAAREITTLRVENPGDFVWRMELAPDAHGMASRDALRWELPARAKQNVTVPAGTYHLRSRLADETNEKTSATSERLELHAGAIRLWTPAVPL